MTHARRRTACLALGLAAAATLGVTGTASADETGTITGLLWFDRDRDQVQDVGEPGRTENGVVLLYRDDTLAGAYDTDTEGRFAVTGLAPGAYRLTYTDVDRYLPTTMSTVDITVTGGGQTTVDFGMKGASISGDPWLDEDFDGLRDVGEPPLDPFSAVNPTYVQGPAFAWSEQDDRGRFRIEDLPSGDGYVVTVIGPRDLALTKEGGDSVVDWITGKTVPFSLAPGADVTGINAGYARVTGDSAVAAGSIDPDRRWFRVGEEITVTLTLANMAQVPDYLQIEMSWPTELELVDTDGLITTFGPGQLFGATGHPLLPRETVIFTVVLRATAPVAHGAIEVTTTPGVYGDGNPRNDKERFSVRVVG